MATILVTGLTGILMRPLCALLLKKGHRIVALVRPKNGRNLESQDRLFILSGDIEKPFVDVDANDFSKWKGKIDKIIHAAASTKFFETPDYEIRRINILGTKNMLDLADKLLIPEFHHISTAYVAGDAENFNENNLDVGQHLRNDYESTKLEAERLIHKFLGKTSIYRLPIIVGDSKTGNISSFSGYYGAMHIFSKIAEKKINTSFHISCSESGTLNLVPIDWITETMANLTEIPATDKTFHLTHPNPPLVKEVIKNSIECLGLNNFTYGKSNGTASRIQTIVDKNLKIYYPYLMKDKESFGNRNTTESLGEKWVEPPDIDKKVIKRLLKFAVEKWRSDSPLLYFNIISIIE